MIISHSIPKSNRRRVNKIAKDKIFVAIFFLRLLFWQIFPPKVKKLPKCPKKYAKNAHLPLFFVFWKVKYSYQFLINNLIIMLDLKILIVYNSKRI